MTQEALKLALEALKANDLLINGTEKAGGLAWCIDGYYSDCFDIDPINEQTERAITAIKEALAQTERPADCKRCNRLEEQAYDLVGKLRVANIKLSMQPQRKPLTDEEIRKAKHHMVDGAYHYSFQQGVRYAEAAHGIKENT